MRDFIRFIIRYHLFFLFLFFETISFYLLVNYNHHHNQTFVNSSSKFAAGVLEISSNFTDYFSLKRANEELSRENAFLRTQLPENIYTESESAPASRQVQDSIDYLYRPAKVINNSINKFHNYITINKGSNHGIQPEMGVISARGLVGVVRHVSPNYATVISLLNTQLKISARLRETNHFGSLEWDGQSYRHAILNEIPGHAKISIGDAVVTSGYSALFPEGILIGTIEDFKLNEGEGFYIINVRLSIDFKNLTYIETVEKKTRNEQQELEKLTNDD
ncbi:MAG: rod shape-determining protein MreC [Bacteroidales bacterium]|nr:rod shape-determining protein MreC [Bacteroidales bacterium]